MLEIKNLHVTVDGKQILNGLDLTVNKGEVHAIMGPNGSGKSTLAYVLAGRADYTPTSGEVLFDGRNLFDMEPDEREGADGDSRSADPGEPERLRARPGEAAGWNLSCSGRGHLVPFE